MGLVLFIRCGVATNVSSSAHGSGRVQTRLWGKIRRDHISGRTARIDPQLNELSDPHWYTPCFVRNATSDSGRRAMESRPIQGPDCRFWMISSSAADFPDKDSKQQVTGSIPVLGLPESRSPNRERLTDNDSRFPATFTRFNHRY